MSSHYNEIFNNNLNKYMINIIYNYVVPNIDKLKIPPKVRSSRCYQFKIPLFDIIIKSIQRGYIGITISKYHYKVTFHNQIFPLDDRLEMIEQSTHYSFRLKNHDEDLYYCDIFSIPDFLEYEDITISY